MSRPSSDSLPDPPIEISVIDQDGDVFDLLVIAGTVRLEVITELVLVGDALLARGLHVSGQGPGTASAPLLRRAARELGQQWNARRVIIEGGVRTTGASPGHRPRRLVIPIHE